MITVGYLKRRLAEIPDDALAYAYEGEIVGIVVVSPTKSDGIFHDPITTIYASESDELEDAAEAKEKASG